MLTLIKTYALQALTLFLAITVIWLWWNNGTLRASLKQECAMHQITRYERDAAITEGLRWKAVAEDAEMKQAALREEAQACLTREKEAQADAAARDAIMRTAKPHEVTAPEKKEVVDDATRTRAVDRLNRAL